MKPTKPKMKQPKTDITPYHGHGKLYFGGLVGAVLLFFGSAALVWNQQVPGWEVTLFHSVNSWSESWYHFFLTATIFHESLWIAAVAVALAFIFRMYRLSWRLAVCSIGGYAVSFIAKHVVERGRPDVLLGDVHARASETSMGFPSGHTMIMTVLMLALLPYLPWRWRWIIPIPIILMGLSRVYLGVHMPLDVVGGFAIGVGVISFVRILPQPLKVFLRLD
ncbi:MAG TPA: phosphatase PAP2 family protein [Candidatus Saccharimonadales bacterium]|nr:phosphatase PAP2 family protein [Candidatus Saccharimonadales bacterium]